MINWIEILCVFTKKNCYCISVLQNVNDARFKGRSSSESTGAITLAQICLFCFII